MSLNILKTILLILCFQVLGCATTLQYTAPRDRNNDLIYKMKVVDLGPCSNCFRYSEGNVDKGLIYSDVIVHFFSPERCSDLILGFIPAGWGKCYPSYPFPAKEYWISLSIENISTEQIRFDAQKIKLFKDDKGIGYDLDGDIKPIDIMPKETSIFTMSIGDWSKIGTKFYVDLTEALSVEEKIIVTVERFTSIKYGLMPTD